MDATLESGITAAFDRSLLWAALISAVVALVAAGVSAVRILRPLEEVRTVAGRLAAGSYGERVPVPAEAELAALATDVNTLAASLEATEQRRIRLIGEVAHELRTPVATLQGYLEGLLDGVFEPDEETLAAAARETARMERLAADLAILSRTEEGQIPLDLAPADVRAIAIEVADRLRPQFADGDVDLTVHGQPTTATVDRDRIAQILTNLIGNALTYTPPGGRVEITVARSEGGVDVRVTDTGRGLDADQLDLVFERFYRADRSAPGGTGIGLTIARSLARRHSGDVTATSPGPGAGSTFTLRLPA